MNFLVWNLRKPCITNEHKHEIVNNATESLKPWKVRGHRDGPCWWRPGLEPQGLWNPPSVGPPPAQSCLASPPDGSTTKQMNKVLFCMPFIKIKQTQYYTEQVCPISRLSVRHTGVKMQFYYSTPNLMISWQLFPELFQLLCMQRDTTTSCITSAVLVKFFTEPST